MMNSWLVETSMTVMKNAQGDQIYLNKDDCARLRVDSGERVKVQSETGSIEAVVQMTPDVRRGVAVMEYGWGNRRFNPSTGKAAEQQGVNSNSLVSRTELDPLSGVPALNGSRIRILKMAV
jgi:anaerobic selenocysteine-containing dehydrogenase